MDKKQAKLKIQSLIERYNSLTPDEKKMKEEMTKTKFIRPLFEALGWNFEEDVILEDNVSRGRVDYNFQISGRTKFFLEAKPLSADVDDLKHAKQATNYAWLKNVNWAILTNFEGIRVFYPAEYGEAKSCLRIDFEKYLDSFEDLWILSKESFHNDLIDKEAVKWGAEPKHIKVSEQLAEDMSTWRNNLCKNLKIWNKKLSDDEIDEGVQKILDRLIFIRSCEDRGLENDSLRSQYRIWQDNGRKGNFLAYLKPLFEEYQHNYNSGLFDYHPCMDWEVDSDNFDEIMKGLYRSRNGQEYDFSVIDSDVLGGVYEQYLGHILQKSDGKDDSKKKRKSQGIYYTPSFIVDYIVQNTLGQILKEKTTEEINNLRILDPACGSGSFLIKAFDYLAEYHVQKKNLPKYDLKSKLGIFERNIKDREGLQELSVARKISILRNNIFGVDLDQQAVEIAQLNLMLKTLERKQQLPHLGNIKCGNSLIDDPKIAGERAFDWNSEFPEIMKDGGFDVIIGNPPWGINFNEEEKNYLKQKMSKVADYESAQYFIINSLKFLKKDGILAFIVPNTLFLNLTAKLFRKFISSKDLSILLIKDLSQLSVFGSASVRSSIIIIKKTPLIPNQQIAIINSNDSKIFMKQLELESKETWNDLSEASGSSDGLIQRIEQISIPLETIAKISQGLIPYDKYRGHSEETIRDRIWHSTHHKDETYKKELKGADVKRYDLNWNGTNWISYGKWLAAPRKPEFFKSPRILIREIGESRIFATYTDEEFYNNPSIINVLLLPNKKYSLKFLLAIINSQLFSYIYLKTSPKAQKGLFPKILVNDVRHLPIYKFDFEKEETKHNELEKLTDKMLKLYEELQKVGEGTNRWNQLKSEIDRTDNQIDQIVYKLYDLTPEEIKIIEDSTSG